LSTTGKKQITRAALIVFTLWPMIHIAIAKQTGMSSWKLAGWGMYATPRLKGQTMHVYGRGTGARYFQPLARPSPEVQVQATLFLERFRWLGTLARPDAFAAAIFDATPGLGDLRVVVLEPILAPETGMIRQREVVYEYDGDRILRAVIAGAARDRRDAERAAD